MASSPLLVKDVVQSVQMHLRPRHVLRLMLASRALSRDLQENEAYWTRVAAHLVWRGLVLDRVVYRSDRDDVHYPYKMRVPRHHYAAQPSTLHLYHMQNLPRGYHAAMEHFVSLLNSEMARMHLVLSVKARETHSDYEHAMVLHEPLGVDNEYHGAGAELTDCYGWNKLVHEPLDKKVREMLRASMLYKVAAHSVSGWYELQDVDQISMRDVCKREVHSLTGNKLWYDRRVFALLRFIEDELVEVPSQLKRKLCARIIETFAFRFCSDPPVPLWPADSEAAIRHSSRHDERMMVLAKHEREEHLFMCTNLMFTMAGGTV